MNKKAITFNLFLLAAEIYSCAVTLAQTGLAGLIPYTVLSNLLALVSAAVFLLSAAAGKGEVWAGRLRYAATTCLTLTFLVVLFVLIPMEGEGAARNLLLSKGMFFHHLFCPVLSFVSYVFLERTSQPRTFVAVLPTILYAIVIVTANLLRWMEGPYPFLLVYQQPWYVSVLWAIVIPGGAWLLATAIRRLRQRVTAA